MQLERIVSKTPLQLSFITWLMLTSLVYLSGRISVPLKFVIVLVITYWSFFSSFRISIMTISNLTITWPYNPFLKRRQYPMQDLVKVVIPHAKHPAAPDLAKLTFRLKSGKLITTFFHIPNMNLDDAKKFMESSEAVGFETNY